jgi:hypothetical protein
LNSKIGFLATLIVTIIIAVYGIELSFRVFTGSGRLDYLAAVLIVLVVLGLADFLFYRRLHSITSDL